MGGPNSWFGKHPDGVILGTGGIHLDYTQAGRVSPSRFLTDYIIVEIQQIFGHNPMHVFREWSCTAGFTDDEYPIVGLLDGKRQYIIAWDVRLRLRRPLHRSTPRRRPHPRHRRPRRLPRPILLANARP